MYFAAAKSQKNSFQGLGGGEGIENPVETVSVALYLPACTKLATITLRQPLFGRYPGAECNILAAENCSVKAENIQKI